MERLTRTPLTDYSDEQIVGALNTCFEGYVVPVSLTPSVYRWRFGPEDIDPTCSSIYVANGNPVAVVLIARRDCVCHVSAMAVATPFRRQGIGRGVMGHAIAEAKARKDSAMLLEVIEQNPGAVALYKTLEFQVTTRLAGGSLAPVQGGSDQLREVDVARVAGLLADQGPEAMPWWIAPASQNPQGASRIGLSLADRCFAIVEDTAREVVIVWTVLTIQNERRQGHGRRMLQAIQAKYPGKSLRVVGCVPDRIFAEFFAPCGFIADSISQFEMRLAL